MSRPLRIEYSGAWYHVMNRGLNHRHIFHDNDHRYLFLDLLKDIHDRYAVQIHAYCLMDNHYHLILHTPQANLSRTMRHLDGVYTQRFNRDVKRDGPLFRGRYKAILMKAEHYLLQLSRYIHLNPVAAKICFRPNDYVWSSYKSYLKEAKRPEWLFCDEVLAYCSQKASTKEYQSFVEEGMDEDILKIFSILKLPSILGDKNWIEQIKNQYIIAKADNEIPESKELMRQFECIDMQILMQTIAESYKVTLHSLKQRGHRQAENLPRNMLIYLAAGYFGFKFKAIAEHINAKSVYAISKVTLRMEEKVKNDKKLYDDLKKIKTSILMSNV